VEASVTFDAIVLCGGAARRLGGADKAAVVIGATSLLDRALDAVGAARSTIVVGPRHETAREVRWTIEDPPGGGPVAAIAAGLDLVTEEVVVVLGVDFPLVGPAHVDRLLAAFEGDGAIYVDETGRHQFLVGAYSTAALRRVLRARPTQGMAVKALMADLELVELTDPRATQDVDTWDDARAAEKLWSN
jgi:molybdopterin-guanine dinucleotide biosynthesis protein A